MKWHLFRAPLVVVCLLVGFLPVLPQWIWAAGKKADRPPAPGVPVYTTPEPVRKVRLPSVTTKPFQLPNGFRVDLTSDLDAILTSVVAASPIFSPADADPNAQVCDRHIEIRATVSTLELRNWEINLQFGYSPSGELRTVSDIKGEVQVEIGTLAMDFSIWECFKGQCAAVAATTADHLTSRTELKFSANFGLIETGASLVYNTALGNAFRKIMKKGIQDLADSPRLGELSWRAIVREYHPTQGVLYFDQGTQSRLQPNQTFVVYAVTESTGSCEVYKPMAYVHTTRVDTISSLAIVDQSLDSRDIQVGDLVLVRISPPPPRH